MFHTAIRKRALHFFKTQIISALKLNRPASLYGVKLLPITHKVLSCVCHHSGEDPVSGGCVGRPAAGGPLNGFSHHEGAGGCCVGGMEHRGLHLWLHPHQRHGGAHTHAGEGYQHPPVCHWAAVGGHLGALLLHLCQEDLRVKQTAGIQIMLEGEMIIIIIISLLGIACRVHLTWTVMSY